MIFKNKIFVFDDIISKIEQENIKTIFLKDEFPWYFVSDVTNSELVKIDKRPGFKHSFVIDEKSNSSYLDVVIPIIKNSCKKINYDFKKILKSRTFLQLPLNLKGDYNLDSPHIDSIINHLVILYYVLDSDGDTIIFHNKYKKNNDVAFDELKEYKKITPKQGRVVIFDGYYYHSAFQPKNNLRCVINTNVI